MIDAIVGDPVIDGDTGDRTPDEIDRLKAFVRRNRDFIRPF